MNILKANRNNGYEKTDKNKTMFASSTTLCYRDNDETYNHKSILFSGWTNNVIRTEQQNGHKLKWNYSNEGHMIQPAGLQIPAIQIDEKQF